MDGFKNVIVRGLGIDSVLLPAAALIGYAVLFFGLATWRFWPARNADIYAQSVLPIPLPLS